MKFTPEQLEKAKTAKNAEELLALVKEDGIELTAEEAEKYFAELQKDCEISDEELDNVSGGCGSNVPGKVTVDSANPLCPSCGGKLVFETNKKGDGMVTAYCHDDAGNYDIFACSSCNKKYRHHWDGDLWTKN